MRTLLIAVVLGTVAVALTLWWLVVYALRSSAPTTQRRRSGIGRAAALGAAWLLCGQIALAASTVPTIARLAQENPGTTAIMAYRGFSASARGPDARLKDLPEPLVRGLVAAEDWNFWSHQGFDLHSIAFALQLNLKAGTAVYGGSTITQQLARTLFLSPAKTLGRKYRELVIALELELLVSKERILELYANNVEWGPGVFGVTAAALYHYGRAVSDLTGDELCRLVTILPSPRKTAPAHCEDDPVLAKRYRQIRPVFGP